MIDVSGSYDIRNENGEDINEGFDEQVCIYENDMDYKRDWNQLLSKTKKWIKVKNECDEGGSLDSFRKKQDLDNFFYTFFNLENCPVIFTALEVCDEGMLFDFQVDNIVCVGNG